MEIRFRIPEQVQKDLEPIANANGYKTITPFIRFLTYELSKKNLENIKLETKKERIMKKTEIIKKLLRNDLSIYEVYSITGASQTLIEICWNELLEQDKDFRERIEGKKIIWDNIDLEMK